MDSEIAWVLVSSGTQVQPQIVLDPHYFPDYLPVSYDHDKNKTTQHSDIPIKIIKENLEIFANFLCTNINSSFKSSLFASCLKMAYVTPLHKKGEKDLKENWRPVLFQYSGKYLKRAYLHKCLVFLITFCQNNNLASGKALVKTMSFGFVTILEASSNV